MAAVSRERSESAPSGGLGRKDLFRFVAAVGAYGLALAILYRSPNLIRLFEPLDRPTAAVTATVLGWLGADVHRTGDVLAHPGGFSYEIYFRCTGLFVAALLVVGLLALPGSRRRKLIGSLLGSVLVFLLNLVRLVSLFFLGVWAPASFGFIHAVVWEAAMLAFVLGYWLVWLADPSRARLNRVLRPWKYRPERASC